MKDKTKEQFFCPIGRNILWHHGLEYSECPLLPAYRDMSECKKCKLKIDTKWKENKERWKDVLVKKKKRKPNKKRNNYGTKLNTKGKK